MSHQFNSINNSNISKHHLPFCTGDKICYVIEEREDLRIAAADILLSRGATYESMGYQDYSDLIWILKYVPSRRRAAINTLLRNPNVYDLAWALRYCPEYKDMIVPKLAKHKNLQFSYILADTPFRDIGLRSWD